MIAKLFRQKRIILDVFTLTVLVSILYFKPFSSTEITILNHLTFHDQNNIMVQICLVKNPPSSSKKMKELIVLFNKENPTRDTNYKRTFIKQQNYILFPTLNFREKIDYSAKTITRSNLDNKDILATSSNLLNTVCKRVNSTKVNTGKIWYYKK